MWCSEAPHGSAAAAMAELRKVPSVRPTPTARCGGCDRPGPILDGPPRHSAVAALATRIVRPGSSAETDAMNLSLTEWAALEQQLGFEVDARVVAYAVGSGELTPAPGSHSPPIRHSACCGREAPRRVTSTCSTTSRMRMLPGR